MCRTCANCYREKVDETKQNFIYRDWEGNKWNACIRPICDKCIEAGVYVEEYFGKRLHLGASRKYGSSLNGFWGYESE